MANRSEIPYTPEPAKSWESTLVEKFQEEGYKVEELSHDTGIDLSVHFKLDDPSTVELDPVEMFELTMIHGRVHIKLRSSVTDFFSAYRADSMKDETDRLVRGWDITDWDFTLTPQQMQETALILDRMRGIVEPGLSGIHGVVTREGTQHTSGVDMRALFSGVRALAEQVHRPIGQQGISAGMLKFNRLIYRLTSRVDSDHSIVVLMDRPIFHFRFVGEEAEISAITEKGLVDGRKFRVAFKRIGNETMNNERVLNIFGGVRDATGPNIGQELFYTARPSAVFGLSAGLLGELGQPHIWVVPLDESGKLPSQDFTYMIARTIHRQYPSLPPRIAAITVEHVLASMLGS